jgi:hypothetical protein
MAKDPIPIPEPDVVRPPTPSEEPAPDVVVNIPEPASDLERSPLPSTIPQKRPRRSRLNRTGRPSERALCEHRGVLLAATATRVVRPRPV